MFTSSRLFYFVLSRPNDYFVTVYASEPNLSEELTDNPIPFFDFISFL